MSKKSIVDGIILIITCQKYMNTRVREFKLSKLQYGNWKVIYALGDLSIQVPYKLKDNLLTIRCEDSYIHLLKKVVLSIEILYELFDIKQGILRCGDDLVFNEDKLIEFLMNQKPDYTGNLIMPNNTEFKVIQDHFMQLYYNNHKEDLQNPSHNLSNIDIGKYILRPNVMFCSGVVLYLSNKCCNVLISHLNKIKYNVFHEDEVLRCYPYTIEDVGIGFILNQAGIYPTHNYLYKDIHDSKDYSNKENKDYLAFHTNKYRD